MIIPIRLVSDIKSDCTVVLQQKCDNIHFYYYYYYYYYYQVISLCV